MNFYYKQTLIKVEEILSRTLPDKHLRDWADINAGCSVFPVPSEAFLKINQPALDLLGRGGKRWRPVLMCFSCELFGGGDKALPLTPLVEFPHNGSLIIDDIEDSSDMRRGKPAVHKLYGTDMAINTGNFIYFQPLTLLEIMDIEESLKLRLYSYYGQALRRLHFGQGLDISWHRDPGFFPGKEEYLQMCRFKTGSLARMAGQSGAAAAGASLEDGEFLGELLEQMGIAFQIMDDVKNLTTGNPGKNRGDDIVEGKKSLPVIYLAVDYPEHRNKISALFADAGEKGVIDGNMAVEKAIGLMEDTGVIAKARRDAEAMLLKVEEKLMDRFSPSSPREAIVEMLSSFL